MDDETQARGALWVYRCPGCKKTCRYASPSKYILCFECHRNGHPSCTYQRLYMSWGAREWLLVAHFAVLAQVADMEPEDLEVLFVSLRSENT